jgi:hypothetical protein
MVVAFFTPNVVRHFKTDDENSFAQFSSPLTQGMLAMEFVDRAFGGIPIGRIILVNCFPLCLCEK